MNFNKDKNFKNDLENQVMRNYVRAWPSQNDTCEQYTVILRRGKERRKFPSRWKFPKREEEKEGEEEEEKEKKKKRKGE